MAGRGDDLPRAAADLETRSRHERLVHREALDALASFDARKAQVVELRYFGGLTVEETAEVLKVSVATVERDWQLARLWLSKTLRGRQ